MTATLEGVIEKLASEYRASLPQRIDDLRHALAAARLASGSTGAFETLASLAHKLRGSAGAFGMGRLGVLAGLVEEHARLGELEIVGELLDELEKSTRVEGAAPRAISAYVPTILVAGDDAAVEALVASSDRRAVLSVDLEELGAQLDREGVDVLVVACGAEPEATRRALATLAATRDAGRSIPPTILWSRADRAAHRAKAVYVGVDYLCNDAQQVFVAAEALVADARRTFHRLLVVDDDPVFASWLAAELSSERFDLRVCHEASGALAAVDSFAPEAVLLDRHMPGADGIDLCRLVRAKHPTLPILVLTADERVETRVACYRAGADDFVLKPPIREELFARLHLRLARERERIELREKDPDSGLLRRAALIERFDRATQTSGLPVAVFVLRSTPTDAEEGGRAIGAHLRARFRRDDRRCRWRDGMYVVCLSGVGPRDAASIATELRGAPPLSGMHVSTGSWPEDGADLIEVVRVISAR